MKNRTDCQVFQTLKTCWTKLLKILIYLSSFPHTSLILLKMSVKTLMRLNSDRNWSLNKSLRIRSITHLCTTKSYLTHLIKDFLVFSKWDIHNCPGSKGNEPVQFKNLNSKCFKKCLIKENQRWRTGLW